MTLARAPLTGLRSALPRTLRVTAILLPLAIRVTGYPAFALEDGGPGRHPVAVDHVPSFITPPGETDVLLLVMAAVLIGAVLAVGVFFFWLHSLPERLVHNSTKVHFDIVAALALLSLFTHIHAFWVAALLIALVRIPSMPDFAGHLGRIAGSLEKMAEAAPEDAESAPAGRVNAASHQAGEARPPRSQASERPPRRVTHA
jgi:hypothetical protein